MAINGTVLQLTPSLGSKVNEPVFIKKWGKMVIDDQQQAEGVHLASRN